MPEFKQKLEKIIERLKHEVTSLRTGRASPALVEDLEVDYYGTKTPLKALASISNRDSRELLIQPWDKGAVQPIERAIQTSSLSLNPIAEREGIRLIIPSLTEERRRELVKLLGHYVEDARIHVRKEREDILREIDRGLKEKEISEDEKFRKKSEIQKMVDEINKKIEEIEEAKEKEIMTV